MSADRPGEFETIAKLLRPLTGGDPAARNLADDAAVLPVKPGHDLVLTKDVVVEGVHFLPEDPLDTVARKALRVNLSDLAAKGAEPFAYLLAVSWRRGDGWSERELFARGLGEDNAHFGVRLLGGDTVLDDGPLVVSVTALGWVAHGRSPARDGARAGDVVVVSGAIGDGFLGLRAAKGVLRGLEEARVEALLGRYRLPEPRLALARVVRDHAAASIDISDGLIADLGHVALASGAQVELHLDRIPLSRAARAWFEQRADPLVALADLASGGDDYEIACAVRPDHLDAFVRAAEKAGEPVTVVGRVLNGAGVRVLYEGGEVPVTHAGWAHD